MVISLACGKVIEEFDIHRFPETAAVVILGIITGLVIRFAFGKGIQRVCYNYNYYIYFIVLLIDSNI